MEQTKKRCDKIMNKKIICIGIISMFLLTGLSVVPGIAKNATVPIENNASETDCGCKKTSNELPTGLSKLSVCFWTGEYIFDAYERVEGRIDVTLKDSNGRTILPMKSIWQACFNFRGLTIGEEYTVDSTCGGYKPGHRTFTLEYSGETKWVIMREKPNRSKDIPLNPLFLKLFLELPLLRNLLRM